MADPLQKGQAFCQLLRESKYVLALLGAGLSASSGIPTFSGAGRTWRSIDAKALATREAFSKNPQLISEYYGEMQQTMAAAAPNAGHVALAELARAKPGFLAITQNIDGDSVFFRTLEALTLTIWQTCRREPVTRRHSLLVCTAHCLRGSVLVRLVRFLSRGDLP